MDMIPEIGRTELDRRISIAKPVKIVHEEKDRTVWEIEIPESLSSTAYLWSPKNTRKLGTFSEFGIYCKKNEKFETFWRCSHFPTLHTYSCTVFFKPTIEEVLSCLPKQLFSDFDRFYFTTDIARQQPIGDYHIGDTTVFLPGEWAPHPRDIDWNKWKEFNE
jgi:hypothetical protein